MSARFVTHPETLDVIVASNLFADILTDLGGAIQGSLGTPPSANLNPERKYPSMFEPVHGSAPDIYGKKISNPIATVWAGAMMLDWLGEQKASELVMDGMIAVTSSLSEKPAVCQTSKVSETLEVCAPARSSGCITLSDRLLEQAKR